MATPIDDNAMDVLFRSARTYSQWQARDVSDDLLRKVFDLAVMGPTSANTLPLRIEFVKSVEAKQRLKPALAPGNVEKTMAAPVCAIMAMDAQFYEFVPKLFPHNPRFGDMFKQPGKEEYTRTHAFRNASLQAGYFILAARAVGLDTGPMSGFDNAKVDAEFFPEGRWKSNFLCNLGYGDASSLRPRLPRLNFEEACRIV
ncbi:MAG TPA: malonic semialdehyde reductase [Tepidisphaeraceae bacterium]|jgi:3-hydroxypropanoate dehydrogenase